MVNFNAIFQFTGMKPYFASGMGKLKTAPIVNPKPQLKWN